VVSYHSARERRSTARETPSTRHTSFLKLETTR